MRREISYDKLTEFAADIQAKLKNCPFCGYPAHLENNVGSWGSEPDFVITCSNDDCFLHNSGLTVYDIEEWEETNTETTTGLKKMLGKMKKMWNRRIPNTKGEMK